jgi:putative redox protein
MVTVSYVGGDRLRVAVRGHEVYTDQPVADGGDDLAPTPTELFVASFGACVAYYAERFLRRHGLPTAGLTVACGYRWEEDPHRVGGIDVIVDAPGLPDERRVAFSRVIDHCTVHNTLRVPPEVTVKVTGARSTAAA